MLLEWDFEKLIPTLQDGLRNHPSLPSVDCVLNIVAISTLDTLIADG